MTKRYAYKLDISTVLYCRVLWMDLVQKRGVFEDALHKLPEHMSTPTYLFILIVGQDQEAR